MALACSARHVSPANLTTAQMDLQAMDRAHRIGQKKPVVVYRLATEGTVEEMMIERAQRKLYLDAAVIQQGRLAEQTKTLTKDEILTAVRFGADAVFKAEQGADPTDADIDALLARGEERSKRDSERLKSSANSLANFTLSGQEKSLYEYEGTDWKSKSKAGDAWSLSLPKRVTKQNYDEDKYYRNAIHGKTADGRGAPKPPRNMALLDFQFFDVERLEPLRQKEMRNYEYRKAHYDRRLAPDAGPLDEAEMAKVAPPLTAEEIELKEKLLAEGFTTWTKKDVNNFVKGVELHGRDDLPLVATEVEGKTVIEVARYAIAFFSRCDEIRDCDRYMRRIHEGEARLARKAALAAAIAKKLAQTPRPWVELQFDWGGERPWSPFTIQSDRFLVCMAHQVGYGRWEELQREVRKSWALKFDWHMKTRDQRELGERVELLAEMIEKEMRQLESQAKKASAKGGAGSKRPREDEAAGSRKK